MSMQGVSALIPSNVGRPLEFSVPLVPPSVNHYKQPNGQRGFFITREAKAFIDAACAFGKSAAPVIPHAGRYFEITITVFLRRALFHREDVDNYSKVALDSISKYAGIITDDRYVTRFAIFKVPVELAAQERTHYKIIGREEP